MTGPHRPNHLVVPDRTAELARISGALVKAIEDAQAMAVRGEFGTDLVELLHHARELHDLALQVLADVHAPLAEPRDLAAVIGRRLAELEAELAERSPGRSLQ